MKMTRTLYPVTLLLDVESLNLLIDAINDHMARTVLTQDNSVKEIDHVLSEVEYLKEGLAGVRERIYGLASQAVTRQHAVAPGSSVHASREGGTPL